MITIREWCAAPFATIATWHSVTCRMTQIDVKRWLVMSEGDIPEHVRQAVYERDGKRCRLCGTTSAYSFSVHHVIYRSEGGTNELSNLILLCGSGSQGCHLKVHSRKHVYQPLLQELLSLDKPITGLALLRHKARKKPDVPPPDGIQRRF